MAKAKAPLSERNANATPSKASSSKKSPKSSTQKDNVPQKGPSLYDVANKITQIHGKKRAREDDENDVITAGSSSDHSNAKVDDRESKEPTPPISDTLKWDCNEIRTKINALIRSGEVKVGEFQDEIGVSARSYNGFLQQSGPFAGRGNNTYEAAHTYFQRRELKGIPPPTAKKAKTDKASKDKDEDKYSVEGITLDGEANESVPIYDTCGDMRTKINAHLRIPGKTQAGFAREIAKTYETSGSDTTTVTGAQIKRFLEKKGPVAGADSPVYYASYVYFEKLRVKHNRPKGKKRQDMEDVHKGEGVSRSAGGKVWAMAGEVPSVDKYGKLHIHQRAPSRRSGKF